ncbi:hypothetical protein [Lentilactobacillus sunkii]|uniref:Uncharacterized protein n=1 Tax=Lentilactobacillus sunkii DSM 19904 TaxID=1423808 RepID=A0A0R1L7D1_9LACO|nr:hypothetical protein [Lentilactobacillus sunkii]KRK89619.1 hypothetical protein FD17_GL001212 [Lentilactobacillus sunkii DSM 19904]
MMNEDKLRAIVETFANYNIGIQTEGMHIVGINGQAADFDANTFMQDQLIEMICKVMANQLIHETWLREQNKK